jgi:hypothetical protein
LDELMIRTAKLAVCAVACMLAACADEPVWMKVERTDPDPDRPIADGAVPGGSAPSRIALNQALTVYFSEPIDPFTVTPESFRVRDAFGHAVTGRLECGTRSVRFVPRAPVSPSLDDGSFLAGQGYRLEVAGMPTSYAVRSRSGRRLERGFALEVRVPAEARELGLPTPFLPVDTGLEPLRLDVAAAGQPRIAADAGDLVLRFNQPLLPSSVRPEAFRIWRILAGADAPEELRPASARVVGEPLPGAAHPGAAVVLTFDPAARLAPTDLLYLGLSHGEDALRDYRDRPVEDLPVPIPIKVDPGDRVRIRDLDLSDLRLIADPSVPLGFEVRSGRIRARASVEARTGAAGPLIAGPRTLIRAGAAFDPGSGDLRPAAGAALEFTRILVPAGAELRLDGASGGLALFACGDVRVSGRLVLERTSRHLPWRAGDLVPVDALLREVGAALVVGGALVVETGGQILVEGAGEGCPLAVVAGGEVRIEGEIPPGCGFALREGGTISGAAEAALRWRVELHPGLPAGTVLEAAAWTDWLPLPAHAGSIDLTIVDPVGGVFAALQVAPPHAIVSGRPHVADELLTPLLPLPLRSALPVPHGAFVRIRLGGTVRGDQVPSIAGFAIHER